MTAHDFPRVWLTKTPDGLMLEMVAPDDPCWRRYGVHYIHVEAGKETNIALPPVSEECRIVPLKALEELIAQGEMAVACSAEIRCLKRILETERQEAEGATLEAFAKRDEKVCSYCGGRKRFLRECPLCGGHDQPAAAGACGFCGGVSVYVDCPKCWGTGRDWKGTSGRGD